MIQIYQGLYKIAKLLGLRLSLKDATIWRSIILNLKTGAR